MERHTQHLLRYVAYALVRFLAAQCMIFNLKRTQHKKSPFVTQSAKDVPYRTFWKDRTYDLIPCH